MEKIKKRVEELQNVLEKRQEQQEELQQQLQQVNNDIFASKVAIQELIQLLENSEDNEKKEDE